MLIGVKINELDLPYVKEYLKVDFSEDDNVISALTLAAQSYINTMLGYKVTDRFNTVDGAPDELTVACLMIISHWYENRQVQTPGTLGDEIKFAVSAIIDAHKEPFKENWEVL
jgi:uncharacterized phage protein (predicted DNA packaging)